MPDLVRVDQKEPEALFIVNSSVIKNCDLSNSNYGEVVGGEMGDVDKNKLINCRYMRGNSMVKMIFNWEGILVIEKCFYLSMWIIHQILM